MTPVRSRRGSRGQGLVELALVAPLLVLLMMVIVDGGRLLFVYVALEEAAQEGAHYMSYEPQAGDVATRVRGSSDAAEVSGATVPPPACTTTPAPGTVTVTASYPLPMITPAASLILGGTVTVSASVTGTNLQGVC